MQNDSLAFSLTQDDSIARDLGTLGHRSGGMDRHSLASLGTNAFQPSSLHDLVDLHHLLPNSDVLGADHGAPQVVLYSEDSDLLAQADQANLFHFSSLRVPRHRRGDSGSDGTSSGGTTPPPPPPATAPASAGLTIHVSYGASVANAPAGFTNTVNQDVQYYESLFSDPVSINIAVGYGEVGGTPLGSGTLGESLSYLVSSNYTQVKNALAGDARTAADSSAVASLPASSPTSGAYWMTTAEAKAVGLYSASGIDGYVGFGNNAGMFDYNNSDGVTSGQYDFYGVVAHEISEVMGRMLLVGGTVGSTARSYLPYDLFHYSSSGVHQFNMGGYFSANGGASSLGAFNTVGGGDPGDWSGATMDSYNAYATPGVPLPVSQGDLTALDVIGWNLGSATSGSGDALTGTAGTDTIIRHRRSSMIADNGGSHSLTHGAGSDHFQYTAVGDGLDRIVDFTPGHDRLDFSHFTFGSNLATRGHAQGTLDPSHFIANATGPANSAEMFWFNTANHTLYFDADGSGGGGATAIAQFHGNVALHNTDIHLV
jgi:hypothetical protein